MAVYSGPGEGHSLDEGSVIIVKHTVKVEAREALRQADRKVPPQSELARAWRL